MSRYEATLDIDSDTDSHAVRHLMELVYDTLREEVGTRDDASKATLDAFRKIREATRTAAPGTLKVVYETRDESFDD